MAVIDRTMGGLLRSVVFAFGMGSVFLGERLIGSGPTRWVFTGVGVALVASSLIARLLAWRRSQKAASLRLIERIFLLLEALGAFGLVLYFAQSDLPSLLGVRRLAELSPRLGIVLEAFWPALVGTSLLSILFGELAAASIGRAEVVEADRVVDAILSGVGLSCAIVLAFAVVYVAQARDWKVDLSYFRTASPGESTRKIVQSLDEPVEVGLFFPPANEVQSEVAAYFSALAKESPKLKVGLYDQVVDLKKAKELGVSGNGVVAIAKGGRREQLFLGVKLEQARTELKSLDQEVQKRLLAVSKPRRVLYFTSGHGERAESTASQPSTDHRSTIESLGALLRSQNLEIRALGLAEGLGGAVPADASAVWIVGPTRSFSRPESEAIGRYLQGGGKALIALDPEAGLDFAEVLSPLGATFHPVTLANDQVYFTTAHQKSDRTSIGTAAYSASHPSVATLSRLGTRAPLALLGAGYLETTQVKPPGSTFDVTVRAHPATWNDLNGNFEQDPPAEVRKSWTLAAAITLSRPGKAAGEEAARALVVADSDLLSDLAIQNLGNQLFALDATRWLLGDDSIVGEVKSEVDRPIEHTRKQDVAWFYSTIFLVPACVVGLGLLITRKKGRS